MCMFLAEDEKQRGLCNWIGTEFTTFTGFAIPANPNIVELVHGLLNQFRIIGEDASLKVTGVLPFHPDACTSEIGTADVGKLAIENQYLEMHPWTKHSFKTIKQCWVFVKILTESWPWLFGVDETDFHSSLDQLCQNRKEWLCLRADLDIKVFDVSGANPQASLDLGDTSEDFGVMRVIADVFQHYDGYPLIN